ncbi:MAG: glutaredoxin family protein [Lachnospiraceae bacterium]
MKGKKRRRFVIGGIFCICLLLLAGGILWKQLQKPVLVSCYMLDQCGGCSVTDHPCNVCNAERQYRMELEDALRNGGVKQDVEFKLYNILYSFNKEHLLSRLQLSEEPQDMIYPVMFVGDTVLLGTEEIEKKMVPAVREESSIKKRLSRLFQKEEETHLNSKTTDKFVFFTMEGCPDCQEAKAWLDKKNQELNGKLYEDFSFYEVGEDRAGSWEMLKKCYILYGRGQESMWVPTILAQDQCLIGMDEIAAYFEEYQPGDEIRTEVPEDYESNNSETPQNAVG